MKKGSALLIVLGMMGFIMVSALAFSAYMRYARLPSSYLRRTSSSRLLIKAALARAINDVDLAIGNNPHPGVGTMQNGSKHNTWRHRVFMGTSGGAEVSTSDTVSPLCFEALAYLPPPLVNAARYYSRLAPSAQWQPLGFDVGRYTYCAVDVSDYFDINRLLADKPRSSSPQRRVSLAYLFEDDRHRGPGSGGAAWDNFMDEYRTLDEDTLEVSFDGKYPLISLADFNLALGRKGSVGIFKSPFYEYLRNGGAGAGFYNTQSDDDENRINRMTFVTDGWFPASGKLDEEDLEEGEEMTERKDINDGKNQPFAMEFLEMQNPAPSDAILGKRLLSENTMKWIDHLSGLGCAALYDYLDPDHVPISLAIPTTERVPMICGVNPQITGSKFSVTKKFEPEANGQPAPKTLSESKSERQVEQTVIFRIGPDLVKGFQVGTVGTLIAYPFLHPSNDDDKKFHLDGRFSLFFCNGQPALRTGTGDDGLHLAIRMIDNSGLDKATGLMNIKLENESIVIPTKKPDQQEDAVKLYQPSLQGGTGAIGTGLQLEGNELLKVTYRWTQTRDTATGGLTADWKPQFQEVYEKGGDSIAQVHCGIPAIKWANEGNMPVCKGVDPEIANDATLLQKIKGGNGSGFDLNLRAAVWLRVCDDDVGKVVDMVPACMEDDRIQNSVNDPYPLMQVLAEESLGAKFPLMLFDTQVSFKLSIDGLETLVTTPQDVKITPSSAIVADPRYNHAPEHWFKFDQSLTPQGWLQSCQVGQGNGRDRDIFMATSDAGYLQSPYEIANLPRFSDLIAGGDVFGLYQKPDLNRLRELPASAGQAQNQGLMWRTYDPFRVDEHAFAILPWTAEGTGFKINPYSDSTNILMAAFANPPVDWKRASTNVVAGGEDYASMPVNEFNKKYAMNSYSSDTKLDWEDLQRVAGRFMNEVRNEGGNWKDAWQEMDWESSDEDRLCGIEFQGDTDVLWGADRKFLYGYWRECFAAKQQLFLIFVRAEPMMMGSGAVGQIPPQLGARAVALVWRDPKKSKENGYPHQTRVLFYRQFE